MRISKNTLHLAYTDYLAVKAGRTVSYFEETDPIEVVRLAAVALAKGWTDGVDSYELFVNGINALLKGFVPPKDE